MGCKTGTAEKISGRHYAEKKLLSSFVGVFPINDPKYLILTVVDEPHPNKQSHGYATAAVGTWIGIAFRNFSLTMIESRIDPVNTPSRRLCRRLGFSEIGLLSGEEWSGEDFSDVIVYRLNRDDWLSADASGHSV